MFGKSPVKARQKPDKRMPMACQRQLMACPQLANGRGRLAKDLAEIYGATVISKRASSKLALLDCLCLGFNLAKAVFLLALLCLCLRVVPL